MDSRDSPSHSSLPSTSLIICSRDRPKLLLETIESVLQGAEVPTEIVIIDQSDVLHEVLKSWQPTQRCEIRYLWTQSVGLGRARNAGIGAAKHEILAFIDDDMTVAHAWFTSLIGALLCSGKRSVVTGQVLPGEAEVPSGFAPSTKTDDLPAVYRGRVVTDVLWAGNMAMRRSTIEDVGVFDQRLGAGSRFPSAEDNDYGFRLLEAGYCIIYVPEAIVYHRAWRAERDYLPLRWKYGRGQGAYYAKHLSLRDRYMLGRLWKHMSRIIFRFPRLVWRQRQKACGDAIFLLGIVSGAVEWMLTQRRT